MKGGRASSKRLLVGDMAGSTSPGLPVAIAASFLLPCGLCAVVAVGRNRSAHACLTAYGDCARSPMPDPRPLSLTNLLGCKGVSGALLAVGGKLCTAADLLLGGHDRPVAVGQHDVARALGLEVGAAVRGLVGHRERDATRGLVAGQLEGVLARLCIITDWVGLEQWGGKGRVGMSGWGPLPLPKDTQLPETDAGPLDPTRRVCYLALVAVGGRAELGVRLAVAGGDVVARDVVTEMEGKRKGKGRGTLGGWVGGRRGPPWPGQQPL
jgi:hypothetical protein